jgi:biotin transport system substrate-specific component
MTITQQMTPTISGRLLVVGLGVPLFALLTGLAAQWEIVLPFSPVPITAQTFVVVASGGVLGSLWGSASQALYLGMGAFGLPFFSGGDAGLEVLVGPTSGYLFGFVLASALVGSLCERRSDRRLITAVPTFLLGHVVIYISGVAGLVLLAQMNLAEAIVVGVVPFLIGDAIKSVLAGLATTGFWRIHGSGR